MNEIHRVSLSKPESCHRIANILRDCARTALLRIYTKYPWDEEKIEYYRGEIEKGVSISIIFFWLVNFSYEILRFMEEWQSNRWEREIQRCLCKLKVRFNGRTYWVKEIWRKWEISVWRTTYNEQSKGSMYCE